MKIIEKLPLPGARQLAAAALCALLVACHSGASDKLNAARQALLATGEYQIEAQDADRGLLTIRSKRDGSLQLIDVNAANPAAAPSPGMRAAATSAAATSTAAPAEQTVAAAVAPGESSAASTDSVRGASPISPGSADEPAAAAQSPTTALTAAEASGRGIVLAHGPRIHIERATGPASTATPSAIKQTLMTGVSISHAVICRDGDRMRLQQVRVDSPSAGIVLQSGCQLELIDSDVRSGDVALVVDSGAILRIENSTISGRIGSLQASNTTRVSSWASDFTGPTLLEGTAFIDRGGNTWQ